MFSCVTVGWGLMMHCCRGAEKVSNSWPSGRRLGQLWKMVVRSEQGVKKMSFYQLYQSYGGVNGLAC